MVSPGRKEQIFQAFSPLDASVCVPTVYKLVVFADDILVLFFRRKKLELHRKMNRKRKIETKKTKQRSFGAFGVTRTIVHRGVPTKADIPEYVDPNRNNIECKHCSMTFKTPQARSVHMKCKHPLADIEPPKKKQKTLKQGELSTPRKNKNPSVDCAIKGEVEIVLNDLVKRVVASEAKSEGAKQLKGKKRKNYTAQFKADALHALEDPNESQLTVSERFGVSQSQISRWWADRQSIRKDAADKLRKLHTKGRKARKYLDLYPKLWEVFKKARSDGKRVSFHWLWTKARVIQKELTGSNDSIKAHVVIRFLRNCKIKMRSRQRNKKKAKQEMVDSLKKWHTTLRERCIKTGANEDYHEKWGHFLPKERLNVDQSPLPFVLDVKKTYEYVEPGNKHHNTWISQPGSGLDKRQCSLQVMFRPEGEQPQISIIFRGKGLRISQEEKDAWHPDVQVFFQTNAWMDQKVNMEWTEKVLFKFVEKENLKKFVLLCDNLEAHQKDDFKESVSKKSGLVWFGLPNGTDLWQPVDAGYAQILKSLIGIEQRDWLDCDNNADRWFCHENPFSAKERRVLISWWVGNAWQKLNTNDYDKLRLSCWQKTGCLITANGEDDNLIKPEGLPDYSVPPPLFLDAAQQSPVSNKAPIDVREQLDETVEALADETELINNEEAEEDDRGNIFDIIDSLVMT